MLGLWDRYAAWRLCDLDNRRRGQRVPPFAVLQALAQTLDAGLVVHDPSRLCGTYHDLVRLGAALLKWPVPVAWDR